jgi:hypothetical protein
MPCQDAVYQWTETLATHFTNLSQPQLTVLAMWSWGMVMARSCALTAVSVFLAAALGHKEDAVRQRLREWCYDAEDKKGSHRQELTVESVFVALLSWVIEKWQSKQLALALDATTLGDRFAVLAISVVYRGCAIPVIWKILIGNEKHAWRGEWMGMLRRLRPAIPATYTVIVLADRGLYARWLYRRIVRLGWHPFLRINAGGYFRPAGEKCYLPLAHFAPRQGSSWSGPGSAFKTSPAHLDCTVLACWAEGYEKAWFILTDLPAQTSGACWYGLRAWIEQGFKITKRGGWQWQRTRITDPERAARLWLAVAVATLWLLSVGGEADQQIPESTLPDVTEAIARNHRQRKETRLREVSIFRRGWVRILVGLLNGQLLPVAPFVPEPWPSSRTSILPGEGVAV